MTHRKKGKEAKEEILFGVHPVTEALKAGRRKMRELFITREKPSSRLMKVAGLAGEKGIPVTKVDPEELATMAASQFHQGICARTEGYPFAGLGEILKPEGIPFLLILDNIVDPHNLGALVRTALCVGMDGVIITKDRAAQPSPTVSKASAGALEHIRIARVANLVNTIRELKKNGVWIAGMDARADYSLYDSDLSSGLGIVVGGEDKGVRPLVRKHCDFVVAIPQAGPVNSLNASVAGAVVMYEAMRQRMAR